MPVSPEQAIDASVNFALLLPVLWGLEMLVRSHACGCHEPTQSNQSVTAADERWIARVVQICKRLRFSAKMSKWRHYTFEL